MPPPSKTPSAPALQTYAWVTPFGPLCACFLPVRVGALTPAGPPSRESSRNEPADPAIAPQACRDKAPGIHYFVCAMLQTIRENPPFLLQKCSNVYSMGGITGSPHRRLGLVRQWRSPKFKLKVQSGSSLHAAPTLRGPGHIALCHIRTLPPAPARAWAEPLTGGARQEASNSLGVPLGHEKGLRLLLPGARWTEVPRHPGLGTGRGSSDGSIGQLFPTMCHAPHPSLF